MLRRKLSLHTELASSLAWVAAWVWAIVAGGGGLLLLLTRGPLPLTNGWFAFFRALRLAH